ncbi:hypothetical protein [Armatimonas sp.]|uniref:hypothetical protein n=1 Tax=Armatimonas sp. TaxID=1872638 RepID=UPI0037502640
MLHLYLLILPCLLVAFALGLLMGYFLWFRTSLNTDTTKILSGDLGALKKKLQERDKQLTGIGAAHAKQLEALNNDLVSAKTERDRLRAEAIPLNIRVDELTRNLETSQKNKDETQEQQNIGEAPSTTLGGLAAIAQERDELKKSLAQAQDKLTDYTQALTQANTNIHTANQTIHTAQAQLQAQAAELERQRPLVPSLATESAGADGLVIPEAEPGHQDDLKEIVGVGPFIEAKLHDLGIRTYKQIAKFSPDMLEKVAGSIEYFQGRIGRENWTEQCKALHFDKYGEKL